MCHCVRKSVYQHRMGITKTSDRTEARYSSTSDRSSGGGGDGSSSSSLPRHSFR